MMYKLQGSTVQVSRDDGETYENIQSRLGNEIKRRWNGSGWQADLLFIQLETVPSHWCLHYIGETGKKRYIDVTPKVALKLLAGEVQPSAVAKEQR